MLCGRHRLLLSVAKYSELAAQWVCLPLCPSDCPESAKYSFKLRIIAFFITCFFAHFAIPAFEKGSVISQLPVTWITLPCKLDEICCLGCDIVLTRSKLPKPKINPQLFWTIKYELWRTTELKFRFLRFYWQLPRFCKFSRLCDPHNRLLIN